MASYKKSVENYCKECVYDPVVEGSWRKQVEQCGCVDCPLYEVRPKTMATVEKERNHSAKKIDAKVVS